MNPDPDVRKWDQKTNRIDLTSVAAPGPDTGPPGVPNNPLRPSSPEVYRTAVAALPSADLPALAAGGYYRLLTFDSPNGTDFTFTAANSTGYGMFAASSPDLVEDANGGWMLDPSTTLNPVFLDGAGTGGTYNGSNQDLVLRPNAGGDPLFLSGAAYSAVPSALLSLADGQTATVDADDIDDGDDMLWLTYDDGEATHGFVVVAMTQPSIIMNAPSYVVEGNSGSTSFVFTITLSAPSWVPVTVDYATADWGATAGTDYQAVSGTLTFQPGETTKTITVLVYGDTTYEGDEWFSMTLSNAVGGYSSMGVSYVSILNDD
jgi:hypothetical protein